MIIIHVHMTGYFVVVRCLFDIHGSNIDADTAVRLELISNEPITASEEKSVEVFLFIVR